jgi:hypothetical protein
VAAPSGDERRLRGSAGHYYYPVVRSARGRRAAGPHRQTRAGPRFQRGMDVARLVIKHRRSNNETRSPPMLRPVKNILNYKILATDGEIGSVSDLIVDDREMKLRYLVIDTGSWLPGKKVVLSTAWISGVAPERETVVMNIEKKRIKEAPEYKPDAQLDRDYETRLHDYYRFPYYWL